MTRCYRCDTAEAVYEAHLDHDCTPIVWLCVDCAVWEREWDSVVWIRTARPGGDVMTNDPCGGGTDE